MNPRSPDTADYWPEWPHTPSGAELEDVFDGVEPVASKESLQSPDIVTTSRGITYRMDALGDMLPDEPGGAAC